MSINGYEDKHVKPVTVTNRIPVLLADEDGDTYLHGIAFAPEGMTARKARSVITQAFRKAKKDSPDEWNYDDVHTLLKAKGFEITTLSVWDEGVHG